MSADQARGLRSRTSAWQPAVGERGEARVIGLVSGKGGVGKSALAVNLAIAASREGRSVLLIDGDAGLTNADLLLGVVPEFDLSDWVEGRAALERLFCRGPAEVDLLLAGRGPGSHEALRSALLHPRHGALARRIEQYDFVFLDLGAGLARPLIELACACARIWLVAVPEPTSLADAYATTKQITRWGPDRPIELLINRVPDRATGERTHQALERMTRRFLSRTIELRAMLPEDAAMGRSVARQTPVVIGEPTSAIARRLSLLAESLVEEQRAESRSLSRRRAAGHDRREGDVLRESDDLRAVDRLRAAADPREADELLEADDLCDLQARLSDRAADPEGSSHSRRGSGRKLTVGG